MPPPDVSAFPGFGRQIYTRRGGSLDTQLRNFRHLATEDMKNVVLDAARLLGDSVVASTPYRTGRAKAHWRFGINSRPGGYDKTLRAGPDHLIDVSPLEGWTPGDNIHLYNKAPYVPLLEAGLSAQAPPGSMLQDNVRNWDLFIQQALRLNGD